MVDEDLDGTPPVARAEAGAALGTLAGPWWRDAVIYQIYPRSFADGNGDGTGDLAGVRAHLPYLQSLGVDAIWFTPWYVSPLADGGYDVADYRAIDPAFGTLADAEQLIAEAQARGIRTIVDVVPNHVSDQHRWFQEALAAGPGSAARERFWFRPGLGANGDQQPTDWVSSFGGDTWTRTVNADGTPGEWYLHLFSPEQPDLNWDNPDVRREHEEILRFWFDRGVAGIRIDSAALLVKDPALPPLPAAAVAPGEHPHLDRDELHDIYRSWRSIADAYDEPRALVGEVWLDDAKRFAAYLRPDEMHSAFNFDFMTRPWDAAELRGSIERTLREHAPVGAPATWVLSNHDITRPVTRYGRDDSGFAFDRKRFGTPTDRDLGTRRARAAALLTAALPGALYIYQGDELGLPEVELPRHVLDDPMHYRSGGVDPGRDGCRVPLPWSGRAAPYGFGTAADAETWLPQPQDWADLTVAAQLDDEGSMLALYRSALALRRARADFHAEGLQWLDLGPGVIAFRRGGGTVSITNFGPPIVLPEHRGILLSSIPLDGRLLPTDSTVWIDE
ncbi:alpha-glucosidase [Microbacterium terrae]|uniref:Oligo-1,6-glucosidase n=1 Tax=Microbacterium terrae TaxID=69369 RepID=A0A0M2GWQ1_9MICO|nr:glycoside hydrolase family 13 protein [Microbacterium terrae]KJL38338.1 Oligo-1,6-glucosidase [Microbacterium terrae]MBP1079021.1 alpha-glucosidase [Microbacterium terrae]GLJ98421.1 alpha-glucosidase [Microbacterium terrae]